MTGDSARGGAGRVAVVTGAGSGIGRAVALQLAQLGASVALVGRDLAKLDAVAREARASDGSLLPLSLDLTKHGAEHTLAETVRTRFGRVDILVHSAGDFAQGSIADTDAAAIRALLETNAVAPYGVTRALMPMLIASGGQVVVMNSSVVGAHRGGIAGYATSKAALAAFTDTLREEINVCGVRVLSVFIGRTATPMQERIHAIEGRAYDPASLLQPDDVATMVIAALALPATAEVTELHIRPMRKPRVNTASGALTPDRPQPARAE